MFPEGGIRDGERSLLEGAPLRAGAAALAQIANVSVVPCVILGADRFYSKKQWLPFRRTPVWIAFGKPISPSPELQKSQARERIESEMAAAFENLFAELRNTFHLRADDLPKAPRERAGRATTRRRSHDAARRPYHLFAAAKGVDSVLCASINWIHRRHSLNGDSRQQMERYLISCEGLSPDEYYVLPRLNGRDGRPDSTQIGNGKHDSDIATLSWRSPIKTEFPANNIARADFFRTDARKWAEAPTVFLLHALMSSSPTGHHRWAKKFNELGWNACFLHLPYHFSRAPTGYWTGELAITPDLTRNAEALRQGVIEVRQIMESLRGHGCREFGVLATSYGGWIDRKST